LLIIDSSDIYFYEIKNFANNIQFLSKLPLFGYELKNVFEANLFFENFVVTVTNPSTNQDYFFVYNVDLTGQNRLWLVYQF